MTVNRALPVDSLELPASTYDLLQSAADYLDRDPELDALVKERVNALRR